MRTTIPGRPSPRQWPACSLGMPTPPLKATGRRRRSAPTSAVAPLRGRCAPRFESRRRSKPTTLGMASQPRWPQARCGLLAHRSLALACRATTRTAAACATATQPPPPRRGDAAVARRRRPRREKDMRRRLAADGQARTTCACAAIERETDQRPDEAGHTGACSPARNLPPRAGARVLSCRPQPHGRPPWPWRRQRGGIVRLRAGGRQPSAWQQPKASATARPRAERVAGRLRRLIGGSQPVYSPAAPHPPNLALRRINWSRAPAVFASSRSMPS